jgi:hypothetical protein
MRVTVHCIIVTARLLPVVAVAIAARHVVPSKFATMIEAVRVFAQVGVVFDFGLIHSVSYLIALRCASFIAGCDRKTVPPPLQIVKTGRKFLRCIAARAHMFVFLEFAYN